MTKRPVIIHDWGREEYLDGARMRYYVGLSDHICPLAYFASLSDARLFAKHKAAQSNRAVVLERSKNQ